MAAFCASTVAEVYAVRVDRSHMHRRYPFSNVLYQDRMYEHFVARHFLDLIVTEFMRDVGTQGGSPIHSR